VLLDSAVIGEAQHHRHRPALAGMPLTRQRTQALLSALCVFRLLPRGFTSRDLRHHLAPLPGTTAEAMTSGQLS